MKKTVVFLILFAIIFVNSTAFAQHTNITLKDLPKIHLADKPHYMPGEHGERQYWLNKKDPAPYAGILLNPEAMALILTEYQAIQNRAEIALEAQRKNDLAVLQLEIGELVVELNAQEQTAKTIKEAQQAEINRLLKTNEELGKAVKDRKRKFFTGAGAAAIGIVTGILIGVFAL